MSSSVEICSQALDRLRDNPITAFSDSPGGQRCGRLFDSIKLRVLTSAPWRSTLKKSQLLTREVPTPPTQFKYRYTLPPDMLTKLPRTVWNSSFNGGSSTPYTNFDIFEGALLTSSEQIFIDYQIDMEPDLFPPHINQLTIYAVMAEVALSVTGQQSTADAAQRLAWGTPQEKGKGGYFREAQRIDSQGHPSQAIKNYPYISVRHAGGGS